MTLRNLLPSAGFLLLYSGLTLIFAPASAANFVTVAGGQAHFRGAVMDSACVVELGDTNAEVQMGQVRRAELSSVGQWADPVAFTLTLTDCDTSVSQAAGIAFQGNVEPQDPMVLGMDNGPGSAVGVGLGIYDEKSNLVVPNSAPRSFSTLIDGLNVLHFMAKYRATGKTVVSGDASVTASFIVLYQ